MCYLNNKHILFIIYVHAAALLTCVGDSYKQMEKGVQFPSLIFSIVMFICKLKSAYNIVTFCANY